MNASTLMVRPTKTTMSKHDAICLASLTLSISEKIINLTVAAAYRAMAEGDTVKARKCLESISDVTEDMSAARGFLVDSGACDA